MNRWHVLSAISVSGILLMVACAADEAAPSSPSTDDGGLDERDGASPPSGDGGGDRDASGSADAGDAGDGGATLDLFDPATIPEFRLEVDDAAMAVLTSTVEKDKSKWVKGTFKHDGVTVADVGIRRKGASTFRALPEKAALKIRFDRNVEGQRYAGLTDLTLNNMLSDATGLAERLGYHAFRTAGFPAQRANTAHVFINDVDYGIYANVETPNRDFLDRVHAAGGPNGKTLFEANGGGEWEPGVEENYELDVGEDEDVADLTALFTKVEKAKAATLLADVASHLDTDRWLSFSALEGIIGQVDGYAYGKWGAHNYYLLGDATPKFTLVPWSLDLTFSDNNDVVDLAQPKPTYEKNATLLMRCKAAAACWTSYKAKVSTMLAAYDAMNMGALAQQWHAQIDTLARADTKSERTIEAYEGETDKLYAWITARSAIVKAQLGLP